nr:hypothetical protein [Bacteroidota bacterium]
MKRKILQLLCAFVVLFCTKAVAQNVGIGIVVPTQKLHVNGNLRVDGAFMPNNLPGTSGEFLMSQGAGIAPVWRNFGAISDTTNWRLMGNTIATGQFIGTLNAFDFIARTANVERLRIIGVAGANQGFIGINHNAPTERLHLNGNFRLDNAFMPGNTAGAAGQVLLSQGAGLAPIWRTYSTLADTVNWRLIGNNITASNFIGSLNAFDFMMRTNNVERMRIVGVAGANQGFVGINVIAPSERLHVAGNMRLDNAFMPGNTAGTTGQILLSQGVGIAPIWRTYSSLADTVNWRLIGNNITASNFIGSLNAFDFMMRTNNVERMRIVGVAGANQGFVGINVIAPSERLHVAGNMRLDNAFMPGNTAGTAEQILLSQGAGIAPIWRTYSSIADTVNWRLTGNTLSTTPSFIGSLNPFDFIVRTNNVERMRVVGVAGASQGYIGVNISAPSERLHVVGNVRFDGALMPNNLAGVTNQVLTSTGPGVPPQWKTLSTLADTLGWQLKGNTLIGTEFIGSLNNFDFIMRTNNVPRVWLKNSGLMGVNTVFPTAYVDISSVSGNRVAIRATSQDSITANFITTGLGHTGVFVNNSSAGGSAGRFQTVSAFNANPTVLINNNGASNALNLLSTSGTATAAQMVVSTSASGQGINLQMLTPTSLATGIYLQQKARGKGMQIDMDSTVNTNEGLLINHKGTGTGLSIARTNTLGNGILVTLPALASGDGMVINHGGTGGYGFNVARSNTSGAGGRIVLSSGSNASTGLEIVQSGSGFGAVISTTNSAAISATNTSASGVGIYVSSNGMTPAPVVTFSLSSPIVTTNYALGDGIQTAGKGHGINSCSVEDGNSATHHDGGIFYVKQSNVSNVNLAVSSVAAYIGATTYKIIGLGTVATIVRDNKGADRIMTAPETPEILFQDFGQAQLINGKAHVAFDSTLAINIKVDAKHLMKVFVQLKGDCKGVYVTNENQWGFDVVELQGGTSNVDFSWFISANRADDNINGTKIEYENNRFKKLDPGFDFRK